MAFGPVAVAYDGTVLSPRPWTMLQARWAADLLRDAPEPSLLELCCGAGHIGLAASALLGGVPAVLVDVAAEAVPWARLNARRNLLDHCTTVVQADVRSLRLGHRFAVVLADPPYLEPDDAERYPDDPPLAVDGGEDGLALARPALVVAAAHLRPDGDVLLQVRGEEQAVALDPCARELGLARVELRTADAERAVARYGRR